MAHIIVYMDMYVPDTPTFYAHAFDRVYFNLVLA